MFVVWLSIKQRMADNGWMYSCLTSVVDRTDEWAWKTDMVVHELGHGSNHLIPVALAPVAGTVSALKRRF